MHDNTTVPLQVNTTTTYLPMDYRYRPWPHRFGSCPNCGHCPHCGRGGYYHPWDFRWVQSHEDSKVEWAKVEAMLDKATEGQGEHE